MAEDFKIEQIEKLIPKPFANTVYFKVNEGVGHISVNGKNISDMVVGIEIKYVAKGPTNFPVVKLTLLPEHMDVFLKEVLIEAEENEDL